jgi:hypothetical protein
MGHGRPGLAVRLVGEVRPPILTIAASRMRPLSAFDGEGSFKLTGNAVSRVPPLFVAGGTSGKIDG